MLINLSSLTKETIPSTIIQTTFFDYTIIIDTEDNVLGIDISHPTKPFYSITFFPDNQLDLSHYALNYDHITQEIEVVYILQSIEEIDDYLEHIDAGLDLPKLTILG